MELYTEIITLKVTKIQKQTLDKLKQRNVKVSNFIRVAIAEKIKRDASELIVKPKKEYCPF
jgi:post-segregation antitoxin (ccd killing protein)